MNLQHTIEECAQITKDHGFDVSQHATQLALIGTEVAEAMELVSNSGDKIIDYYSRNISGISAFFEDYRKSASDHSDESKVIYQDKLNEELADICIRVFSYVGGNDQTEAFLAAMAAKIAKNRNRPHKHGKGF